jgi:hypothetical protein
MATGDALAQSSTNAVNITVVQPDGKPAPGATVQFGSQSMIFSENSWELFTVPPNREVATDSDGLCAIVLKDHYWVIARHRTGSAELAALAVRTNPTIRLEPWARVEGVVRVAGKPLPQAHLGLQSPIHHGEYESPSLCHSRWESVTDAQGRFVFTNLAPGDYLLYRTPFPVRGGNQQSHRWPLVLRAGETQRIDYTFGGRPLVGRAEAGDLVDWQNDRHLLVAKNSSSESWPARGAMTANELDIVREAWARSEEHLAAERKFQVFQLVFDPDGNFRADDVLPGTYEIRIRLTKPPQTSQGPAGSREELGRVVREVTVPAGAPNEAFDVGTLEVPLKNGLAPKPPLSFKAARLEGGEFDVEKLRGRPVVLVFWAEWALASNAALLDLQKLRTGLTNADGIAWASVNLGDPGDGAREGTAALSTGWTHVQLKGDALFGTAETIELHTVPSTLLLDARGRIIARDPDMPRLRTMVQRLLKTANN